MSKASGIMGCLLDNKTNNFTLYKPMNKDNKVIKVECTLCKRRRKLRVGRFLEFKDYQLMDFPKCPCKYE